MTNKINSNLFKLVLHYHKSINQVLQDYELLLDEYFDEEEALEILEDYYKHESDKHESDKHESDKHESDKHESDKHE